MAVATAMTAERRPMCLSIACRTMVVALASRSGVIGMVACGPLTAAGRSRWFGASPAALGRPAAASITARQAFTGWELATWRAAATVTLAGGLDGAAPAAPALATPPSASAAPRKTTLTARSGRRRLGRAALISKDGPFHLFPVARPGAMPAAGGLLALPARHARASRQRLRPWGLAKADAMHCRCAGPGRGRHRSTLL